MSSLFLGIFLATCGAAALALGMATQRYALSSLSDSVPLCGLNVHRNAIWFMGLVIYGVANGFYASSLLFGPLSLLAGVFTTLLIFNMIFARYFLGEELTYPRVCGSVLILIGVVLCVAGTPTNVDTDFSPQDITDLSRRPIGAAYFAALILIVLASVCSISWYEFKYPSNCNSVATENTDSDCNRVVELTKDFYEDSTDILPSKPLHVISSSIESKEASKPIPPEWIDGIMGLVYPGSLGVDEGIAHLTMKASISMLNTCEDAGQCGMSIIYVFVVTWIVSSIATLWWLRRVFSRYEATAALPVEYGAVNVCSVCSGLIYYKESRFMSSGQLALMVSGVLVILCGISVARISVEKFSCAIDKAVVLSHYHHK